MICTQLLTEQKAKTTQIPDKVLGEGGFNLAFLNDPLFSFAI